MYFEDTSCPVCPKDSHLDTIPNLVTCPTIESKGITTNLEYENIISHDTKKQHEATLLFIKLLESREELLTPV